MSLQVTTGLQKSFVSVGGVCVLCVKKTPKTFVYINYSVCIDVCETKIKNKKKILQKKKKFLKVFCNMKTPKLLVFPNLGRMNFRKSRNYVS